MVFISGLSKLEHRVRVKLTVIIVRGVSVRVVPSIDKRNGWFCIVDDLTAVGDGTVGSEMVTKDRSWSSSAGCLNWNIE